MLAQKPDAFIGISAPGSLSQMVKQLRGWDICKPDQFLK